MANGDISPWFFLGKPTLYLGVWTACDQTSINPNGLLRTKFNFLNEGFDGYVLMRNLFLVNGLFYFCKAEQVYPDKGYNLVQLPYPEVLQQYDIDERLIQCRPREYNRRYGQGLTQAPLEIEVEELQPL